MSATTDTSKRSSGHDGDGQGHQYPNLHCPQMPQPGLPYPHNYVQNSERMVDHEHHASARGQMYQNKLPPYPKERHCGAPVYPLAEPQCYHCNSCSTHRQHQDMPSPYSQPRLPAPSQQACYQPTLTHPHNQAIRDVGQQYWTSSPWAGWCTSSDTMLNQRMSPGSQYHYKQASVQGQYGFKIQETGTTPCSDGQFQTDRPLSAQSQTKLGTHQDILDSSYSKAEATPIDQPSPNSMTPMLKPQPSYPEGSTIKKEGTNDNTGDLVDRFAKLKLDPHVQGFTAGSAEKGSHGEKLKESHEKRQKESQDRHNDGASERVMEVYKDRFLLSGLTEEIGEETLHNFAEITSGHEVTKTEYSTDLSRVVVTLDQLLDDEDWSCCRKKIARRKIEGKELKFSHITLAHSVCVREKHGMIEPDSLENYFSSPRSGNKAGSRVTVEETTDHLVVTFEDHSAVENVLAHGEHCISGQSFNISVYYDNIGYVQERSKVSTTRVYTKLSCHEIQLLEVSELLNTWLKELTHLDEASIGDENKVKLKGTEADVRAVEDKIDQFRNQIVDTCIECSPPKMEYLLSLDGKAHTLAKMKEKKIQSIWYKDFGKLKVMSRSKHDFEHTKSWINKHLFEICHNVPEESQNIVEEKLDVLRMQCVNEFGKGSFCLDYAPETKSILAVAQHEVKFQIEERLKETFPKPIPFVTEEMQLPQRIQKFMKKYKAELINKFGKDGIIWSEDSISLSGKADSVQSAMHELEKVKMLIHESDIVCRDMRIPLDKAILDCFIDYIERTERCIIMWQFVRHPESFGAIGRSGESVRYDPENPRYDDHQERRESNRNGASGGFTSNTQKKCAPTSRRNRRFKVDRPSQIAVILITGEIAKAQADVIVNVVDKSFSIDIGAVSKSIMKLGGKELISECKKRKSQMSEGQFVVTGSGSLICKGVMHCHLAHKDNPKAAEILIDLIERMLEEANKKGWTIIALPALGTGALLQYDPGVVANSMYSAVHKFEKRTPANKMKEVQFVLHPSNTAVVQAFQEVERSRDAAMMKSGVSGHQTSQGKDLQPKIRIVSGELAAQKVDVIVNSTNTCLSLNVGSVSKSILQAGGELLQSECRDYLLKHSTLKPGGFVVTYGGKLKCSHVYHACLPIFSPSAPKLLSNMVYGILEYASSKNVGSIAFPAFGTGNLNYPSAEVANIMFNTIHKFRTTRPHFLKEVLLVVYTKDTGVLKNFKSEEAKFLKHRSVLAHGKPGNHNHNNSPVAHGNQPQKDPGKTLQFGPCTVVVKQGNIAQETVECIVNPVNNDMDLRLGSVSKALFHVGGTIFQKNSKLMRDKLSTERVVAVQLTDQTAVLHVRRDFIESNQKQAIIACLSHADKKDYKTIAFPVLKTGTGSQVVEEMANDLHSAVTQFFQRQTVISCISVVIYQSEHVHQFYDKAKELVARGTHDILSMERETRRSEGCQQVCFKLCSDDPLCKKNVECKISHLQDNSYFTETVRLPPCVSMKDVCEVGKELPVNIMKAPETHSINVLGKGTEFLKGLKSLHQMIDRKVAEHQHSAFRQRTQSVEDPELFGAGSSGKLSEAVNMLTVTTKETIRYDLKRPPEASMDSYSGTYDPKKYDQKGPSEASMHSYSSTYDPKKYDQKGPSEASMHSYSSTYDPKNHGNQTYNPHSSETSNFGNVSNMSAFSKQYEEDTEERASSAASLEAGFAVSREAPQTAHPMKWYYLDGIDEILESYEQVSEAIEQAYLRGDQTYDLPDSSGQKYVIDFEKMEEVDESNPEDKVAVLRREDIMMKDLEDMKFPKKWTEMEGDMAIITLKASEEEYTGVRQIFKKSSGDMDLFILKIERLQNKTLCGRFMAKKKQMGKDVLEEKLWHSCQTSADCIVRISNHGTNLNYCRNNNGEPLGKGIYFSKTFNQNATTYTDGSQYAFLCRVLVGLPAKGQPQLRDPPSRPSDDSSFYDSVVDDVQNPSTYVIFSDTQVYPEYLVTYKINKE